MGGGNNWFGAGPVTRGCNLVRFAVLVCPNLRPICPTVSQHPSRSTSLRFPKRQTATPPADRAATSLAILRLDGVRNPDQISRRVASSVAEGTNHDIDPTISES